jgi:hypothetical protein
MLSEGLISEKEADWHTAEPTASSTKPANRKIERPAKATAFSLAEVETGLKSGITSKRMTTLVTTYGVDFALNPNTKKRLADDGADDALLQTIASTKR